MRHDVAIQPLSAVVVIGNSTVKCDEDWITPVVKVKQQISNHQYNDDRDGSRYPNGYYRFISCRKRLRQSDTSIERTRRIGIRFELLCLLSLLLHSHTTTTTTPVTNICVVDASSYANVKNISSWFRRFSKSNKEWNVWSSFRSGSSNRDNASSTTTTTSSDTDTTGSDSGVDTTYNQSTTMNETTTTTTIIHNSNNSSTNNVNMTFLPSKDIATTTTTTTGSDDDFNDMDANEDDNETTTTTTNNPDTTAGLFFSTSNIMTKKRMQFLDRISILASSIMRKDTSALNMNDDTSTTSTTKCDDVDDDDCDNDRTADVVQQHDLDGITPQSDLTLPGRYIHIVTTAALPWFTGTAVNPLLRAAYLHRTTQQINNYSSSSSSNNTDDRTRNPQRRYVTLVIPWLELPEDQVMLYNGRIFANCSEQEQYIRDWIHFEANMSDVACPDTGLQILFYPGRYHPGLGSIFAMGDIIDTIVNSTVGNTTTIYNDTMTESNDVSTDSTITDDPSYINNDERMASSSSSSSLSDIIRNSQQLPVVQPSPPTPLDICVLEEPEHCNWYRAPGDGWTKRFKYVVGIVHTNYKEYASSHYSGLWTAPAIALMSSAMIRAYCHKVIKLSNTLQSYAVEKESTSNVHGVRSNFWQEGLRRSKSPSSWEESTDNSTTVYFIGKLLWAKGLDLMLELEDYYKQYTGEYFPIDIYGSGPDQRAITRAFHGRRNSVNANPKKEAEIEAMDNDDDDDENDENCAWDEKISSQVSNVGHMSGGADDDDENVFWSSSGTTNDLYIKAKQTIAQFKATINTAVDIHEMTKEHIAKIKDTINNVELPTTFAELRRQPIPANFLGRVDHGTLTLNYRIFCNPSISEVLCTTTAEALAMGKYAIIPVHPSNTFFLQFPNCLAYRNKFEFVANLRWALTHDPEPLTPEQIHQFTWEAATERFIVASAITWRSALERERLGLAKLDERIAWFHNELGKGETGDFIRKVLGAGPASHQVKYQKEKDVSTSSIPGENDDDDDANEDEDDSDDDEESGLSRKFRRSSFAQAIRAAVKDFSSFGIQ